MIIIHLIGQRHVEISSKLFSSHVVRSPSVRLSVHFSRFHPLLENHWANFNQTWQKAFLGEGDSSLFKYRSKHFLTEDNNEIVKVHFKDIL